VEAIREIVYKIIWAGKEVTKDVSPFITELIYTDHLHGKSDEIQIIFEDRDSKWKSVWYPQKGDIVQVSIGIIENNEKWLNCGKFQIDELEYNGPPDIINVKGLATFVSEPLRQSRTHSWENSTLSKILTDIAKRNKLKPVISINPDINFKRIDQKNETDLSFAKTLCEKYGYCIKIDSERLIVTKPEELEKNKTIRDISRASSEIISFRFSTKTCETYKACEVKYWDPVKKKEIKYIEKANNVKSGSILKLSERFENKKQAIERAKAALKDKNKWECESEITLLGDPYCVAGANVNVSGFGNLDGKYLIEEARHTLNKSSGYTTSIKIRKI